MKITYRYSFLEGQCDRDQIRAMGVKYEVDDLPAMPGRKPSAIIRVYIDESLPRFSETREFLEKLDDAPYVRTKFTAAEISTSKWLEVGPSWHHGYPMPDDGGYKDGTYDRSKGCPKCGVGWLQKAPFQMKKEPTWGKRQVLQLNWVFDEYFVRPEVYETVFKPFGIGQRSVLHWKTREPLKTVVQLDVKDVAPTPLIDDRLVPQVCELCEATKYLPHTRGFFPRFSGSMDFPILKTQEYFGSGGSAWRAVIINSALYKAIKESKLQGVEFTPFER